MSPQTNLRIYKRETNMAAHKHTLTLSHTKRERERERKKERKRERKGERERERGRERGREGLAIFAHPHSYI